MRIYLRDQGQAKKLAKRLKTLSENSSSEHLGKLPLSRCQHLVAGMLGYRDWHELQRETAKGHPPSADDRDIPHDEMVKRRHDQAEALRQAGIYRHTAAALVDSLVPSGNPEREREVIAQRPARPVDEVSGLSAELLDTYLNDRNYRIALGDILIDHDLQQTQDGLFEAHLILAERMHLGFDLRRIREKPAGQGGSTRAETQTQAKGYLCLMRPDRLFYQGYMIQDMGEAARAEIRRVHEQGLEMMEKGGDPEAMSGALQASLCHLVQVAPEQEQKLAMFADTLAEHVGHPFFVVIGRETRSGGYSTSIEVMRDVNDVAEMRRRLKNHPTAKDIERRLMISRGLGS